MTVRLLQVERLTRHFGKLAVVQGVNFEVLAGENRAVIGPNGAGKTTLFNLISGEIPPTEGQIWFGGKSITRLPPHAIVQLGLARSFQLTNLFPDLSVYDNVWLAVQTRHGRRGALLRAAHKLDGLDEKVWRVLDQIGLEAVAQQPASELSYGHQRHLEIGLALATEPRLLLLDEPTSGISPAETMLTISLIQRISRQVTLLLIEHDMDVVMSVADRILVMHHGRVLADDTPDRVSRDQAVQEAYLGAIE